MAGSAEGLLPRVHGRFRTLAKMHVPGNGAVLAGS